MDFFHRKKKCDQCNEKFTTDDNLIYHARHVHHQTIVNCAECGKEFIHEKDRLHHARKEHDEKMKKRSNKESFPDKKTRSKIEWTSKLNTLATNSEYFLPIKR
ncbi:C2H2-type zinc finger protein [Candidatus Nitrosotenuis sp. DW1]|uniref:C2H2-type zinc finger protein n=1 Tax=Candidatus Nitrosotenuis sp. DW1 TaxID=2259672 RepID=UPI0021068AE9|nr:C2H2-type zinc finger protein [Candidatus Nitrosotenuis sp. DW1]